MNEAKPRVIADLSSRRVQLDEFLPSEGHEKAEEDTAKAREGPERVFTYRGHPVAKANTKAWRHALGRLGIEDFRWHDLRHTWASWHLQNGTPLPVLQESAAGARSRWCNAMRIPRRSTWPSTRIAWPAPAQFPAQSEREMRTPQRGEARNLLF